MMTWLILLMLPLSALSDDQIPPIGIIDFYGLRTISEQLARQALQIKEGDTITAYPKEARRRLEALPRVAQARLNLTCCEACRTILYVGIREDGVPSLQFRPAPKGKIRLFADIVQAGEDFQKAFGEAVEKGDAGEDHSRGHAWNHNPAVRAIQERFITFAARHLNQLRDALHNSADARHRALAAQVLAYAANKQAVVADLVEGMHDPAEEVRNNSMRALWVITDFARLSPERQIRIPPEPFVEMLNSLDWLDRNKASLALWELTANRDSLILSKLHEHAVPSLIEMARWKSPGHAQPAFFLLGRVGGLSEVEIQMAWSSGNREGLIESVLKRARAK